LNCVTSAPRSKGDVARVEAAFGPYLGTTRLNLGCASNYLDGFTNLDLDRRVDPDVLWDLEEGKLPFPAGSFESVFGSHVFEHVRNFLPLVADIHRVLRPGGHLIAVTPYGSADGAWDSPHHVRGFSENTWYYTCPSLYHDTFEHAGRGAWQGETYKPWKIVQITLVPFVEFMGDPDLEFKKKHWRNVIQEVHAVLQKVSHDTDRDPDAA
jgi:SAM-dependent methyltransferase